MRPSSGAAGHRSARRWIFPLLVLALTASPAAASAATITFDVTNAAGRPQILTNGLVDGKIANVTDYDGRAQLFSLSPGDVVSFTREQEGCFPEPPEGRGGVTYTVPASPPATAQVTLPTILGSVSDPPAQRIGEFVGLINQKRQQRGLAPLEISTVLDAAAQYQADKAPFAGCVSFVGVLDSGWPTHFTYGAATASQYGTVKDWVGEYLYANPDDAFGADDASIGVGLSSAGLGEDIDVVIGKPCPAGDESRCGMTGQGGNPTGGGGGTGGGGAAAATRLRLAKAKRLPHRRVRLRYRFAAAAKGTLAVKVDGRGRHVAQGRGVATVRVRLRPGNHHATAHFAATGGWESTRICSAVTMYKRHNWHVREHRRRLPIHPCG